MGYMNLIKLLSTFRQSFAAMLLVITAFDCDKFPIEKPIAENVMVSGFLSSTLFIF
jgi:hypothetical protein